MKQRDLDMSVFKEQDFDCEFKIDSGDWVVGRLTAISGINTDGTDSGYLKLYQDDIEERHEYCRPRLNHWHFNDGSMVLPDGLVVLIRYTDHQEVKTTISKGRYLSALDYTKTRKLYPVALKIIGVAPNCGLDDWAERHDVPVLGGEV